MRIMMFVIAAVVAMGCGGTPERVAVEREQILALREVSGLGRGTIAGADVVVAIGDEANAFTVVPIKDGIPDTGRAKSYAVGLPVYEKGSQLEAVAVDADGHVWLLAEGAEGALTEVVVEGDATRIVRSGQLAFPAGHALASKWHADPNVGGEGMIVAKERVLVAKQMDPTAIVAFTWQDGKWVGGTTWNVALEDLSDLALGPDGAIYAIGASAEKICRLGALPDGGGDVACQKTWTLPAALGKGKTQWEGLTFLADGRPLVAVDRKKSETPNMAILPKLTP